ncbi:hypothetical protein [Dyella acidisoli]|uniref:Uncharacterized protein n=1 Tax=Dyella acidisoli TaxID=1867834 RepID=A0ABQ5XLZ6_9GAMM|nr:hypothetical protein [Dyella acidisoli]GLQ92042.1 hypothetical protein GCM10007901_09930 [Dyella acidisoli]
MGLWAVLAFGEGFVRSEGPARLELYGVVEAASPDAALIRAIHLAKQQHPALAQEQSMADSSAVIHAEEINEIAAGPGVEVDVMDVYWSV